MKNEFIEVASYSLINQLHYTNSFKNIENININIFKKISSSKIEEIQFLDGNSLTIEIIDNIIQQNKEITSTSNSNKNHIILQVFLFESKPMESIINHIQKSIYKNTANKIHIYSLVIDFSTNTIFEYIEKPFINLNVLSVLKTILNESLHTQTDEFGPDKEIIPYKNPVNFILETPNLTYFILALNTAIYLAIVLYGLISKQEYNSLLDTFGAKVNVNISNGEYWRLFTPMFLHGDIKHLFFNMLLLLLLGSLVERIFGHYKFIIFYIVSGLYGNLLSYCFTENDSVGASGAIFGLLGVLIFYGICNEGFFKTAIGANIMLILGFNLFYGLTNPRIDNFAHLGGLLGGFLITGVFMNINKKSKVYLSRDVCIISMLIIIVFCMLKKY